MHIVYNQTIVYQKSFWRKTSGHIIRLHLILVNRSFRHQFLDLFLLGFLAELIEELFQRPLPDLCFQLPAMSGQQRKIELFYIAFFDLFTKIVPQFLNLFKGDPLVLYIVLHGIDLKLW